MKNKFVIGDWCFYDYELCQIQEMEMGRVTSISTGQIRSSGNDLTCYPLTLQVKSVSDSVKYWSDKIHDLKHNSLNHPDIHRKFVELWIDLCEAIPVKEKLETAHKNLSDFAQGIIRRVEELRYEQVEGVALFRR